MPSAEVIVIGGGVNGASVLFHLALAGVRDLVLLEQGHLAAGATGKSGALVRMHYTNLAETRLAHESLRVFRHWDEIVGGRELPTSRPSARPVLRSRIPGSTRRPTGVYGAPSHAEGGFDDAIRPTTADRRPHARPARLRVAYPDLARHALRASARLTGARP